MKKLFLKLLPILAILVGLYWMAGGVEYGLWVRKGPGGGFLPMFAGIATVIFAIWVLIEERSEEASSEMHFRKALLPIAALIGLALASYVIGLALSIATFIILWLAVVEKHKIVFSITTGVITTGVLYGIFVMWLQVPFPLGLLEYLL